MKAGRRAFLQRLSLAPVAPIAAAWPTFPRAAHAAAPAPLLVLVELRGGNDALNTVIPYADATYRALRPRLAIPRDQVLQLDEHAGLHPALAPLMPAWAAGELAVVQGVGAAEPSFSHFRASEIWETASRGDEYLESPWTARAASCGASSRVSVVRVRLDGFDTHASQFGTHAALLANLAGRLAALRTALRESGRWGSTVIATHSEFGRRPRENAEGGTDHGGEAAHLVLGGAVRGGLHGPRPALDRLDGEGHLAPSIDLRAYCGALARQCWGDAPRRVFGDGLAGLDLFKNSLYEREVTN
jgi:uncharacterized protein (DUF1501 family)